VALAFAAPLCAFAAPQTQRRFQILASLRAMSIRAIKDIPIMRVEATLQELKDEEARAAARIAELEAQLETLQIQPAALHVLRLHENPPAADDRLWLLDCSDESIAPGDLVYFPELSRGAGVTEGLRFAGAHCGHASPTASKDARSPSDRQIPLHFGEAECPVFPRAIVRLLGENVNSEQLRARYEAPLEMLMAFQGGSLADVFGGDAEAFWAAAIELQRSESLSTGQWIIPLSRCERLPVYTFR